MSNPTSSTGRGWSTTQLAWGCIGSFVAGAVLLSAAGFHWVGQWQTGDEVAQKLASGPSVAFRYMKENLNRALMGADVDEYLDIETTHQVHCSQTHDHQEAARAFVEKRDPVFLGR